MTEDDLIARVLAGEADAERALYDRYVDRIHRLTYRMTGDPDRASEYTQDTFVRAFDRLASFRGEAALGTWLTAIAISVVYNGQRKVKRLRHREVALDEAASLGATPRTDDAVLRDRVTAAVDDLPAHYRTVLVMHDLEGYTHQEIAQVLDMREGTSKAQLSRARANLRVALADLTGAWVS